MATFSLDKTLEYNALAPTAVLLIPLVLACSADEPNAVLNDALLSIKAMYPKAVLEEPIIFAFND